jgi:S-formylglutathione hydrolase FrmB
MVDRFDVDPERIAIGGISMGGFGAYDIARLDPGSFCAVGGHSPALWESAGETADGAFDDADDFAANDVIAIAGEDPNPYEGARLWLDAGENDPFLPGDEALEETLRANGTPPIVSRSPGGHDSDYWNGNWEEYLGFYSRALGACRAGTEDQEKLDAGRQEGDQDAKGEAVSGSRGPSRPGAREDGD